MSNIAKIIHSSIYAEDPQKAAYKLAQLVDGIAKPFHPCEGAWVCFLNEENWESELIEFYPKNVKLHNSNGGLAFEEMAEKVRGVGTHFNLSIPRTRRQIEDICSHNELTCKWRDWAKLIDIWLEPEILIECVPIK